MTVDLRLQVIRRAVLELIELEGEIAGKLEQAQQLTSGHADALAVIQRLRPMVQTHRDRLAAYILGPDGAEPGGETAKLHSAPGEASALADVLGDLSTAFHRLAVGYAMLYEVALRLYDLRLREIALQHMKAQADAALSTARLLPGVVTWQLAQDGLHCTCTCPMCAVGACGCVAWGTEAMLAAWHDAAPAEPEPPGFMLLPPKPESELARAGVQGGDLVLAVDGQQIRGRQELQDALRKRTLGDEVRFLIRRGSQSPREFIVRHAGDYPKA